MSQCDLDLSNYIRETILSFAAYTQIEDYRLIAEQTRIVRPPE